MSTRKKWLYRILGGIVGLLILVLLIAGFAPVQMDPAIPPEQYGAGSSSVQPSYTGLLREFPPENAPIDNPTTPEKAELGRLLFLTPFFRQMMTLPVPPVTILIMGLAMGCRRPLALVVREPGQNGLPVLSLAVIPLPFGMLVITRLCSGMVGQVLWKINLLRP